MSKYSKEGMYREASRMVFAYLKDGDSRRFESAFRSMPHFMDLRRACNLIAHRLQSVNIISNQEYNALSTALERSHDAVIVERDDYVPF